MALSDRTLRGLAWAVWWFSAAATLAAVTLAAISFVDEASTTLRAVGFITVVLTFPLVGVLILRRQPRNTIGWLLQGIGLIWGLGACTDIYARYGILVAPGSLPRPDMAAALNAGIWAPAIGLMGTFLILLYPDGRLPSPRWRPVGWLCAVTVVALTTTLYLTPGPLGVGPVPTLTNPFGFESARPVLAVTQAVFLSLLPLCFVTCAVALVLRFRRSRGVERLQLKWLATAAAAVAGTFLVAPDALDQVSFLSFGLLPAAIGIAILRHGLYDIDVIINRTLVYGSLTAALAGMYLGSVLLLQLVVNPLTDQSDLAVAGSTLAVAALFRPARARIQATVDRRFYRGRYDAARTMEGFSRRLRQEVDLDTVSADLRSVVRDTVQPSQVSLWLRSAP